MGVSLDLRKAHASHYRGDLVVVLSWINDLRAMFIIPRYAKGAAWFVIEEPAAHFWRDDVASNIWNAAKKSLKACEVLGLEPSLMNSTKIISLVNNFIPDLLRMPSAPPTKYINRDFGQMTMREGGKVLAQQEIRLEDEGQEYV
jgi:hypothetical protein